MAAVPSSQAPKRRRMALPEIVRGHEVHDSSWSSDAPGDKSEYSLWEDDTVDSPVSARAVTEHPDAFIADNMAAATRCAEKALDLERKAEENKKVQAPKAKIAFGDAMMAYGQAVLAVMQAKDDVVSAQKAYDAAVQRERTLKLKTEKLGRHLEFMKTGGREGRVAWDLREKQELHLERVAVVKELLKTSDAK